MKRWMSSGLAPLRVAVNISPSQLRLPEFVESFLGALAGWSTPEAGLDIEITEGALRRVVRLAKVWHRSPPVDDASADSCVKLDSAVRYAAVGFGQEVIRIGVKHWRGSLPAAPVLEDW